LNSEPLKLSNDGMQSSRRQAPRNQVAGCDRALTDIVTHHDE